MHHYLDDEALVKRVRRIAPVNERDKVEKSFRKWLSTQPELPDLVGASAAARILGIQPTHITRMRQQGRIRPIPIDGSVQVYVRSEVEAAAAARRGE